MGKRLNQPVSDALRAALKADGRSLNEIGRACGVAPAVLSRFVSKERDVTVGTADRICRALGLALVEIERPSGPAPKVTTKKEG